MTNYKELANRLQEPGPGTAAFYEACDQAAAILRSLDVQRPTVDEVMALADEYGTFSMQSGFYNAEFDESSRAADENASNKFAELRIAIEALAAPVAAQPPFEKDSWQHAVDNQLVGFGRTSQEFDSPHAAVRWLIEQEIGAAQANKPLSDAEIESGVPMHRKGSIAFRDGVRWAEQRHGIKERG